jgi:hypothetical protein|tara:strand:- start:356 stop:493 length:138 start_codon:yes stop_codon:yes gene_type:complete
MVQYLSSLIPAKQEGKLLNFSNKKGAKEKICYTCITVQYLTHACY